MRDEQQATAVLRVALGRSPDGDARAVVGDIDAEAAAERPHFEGERAALALALAVRDGVGG